MKNSTKWMLYGILCLITIALFFTDLILGSVSIPLSSAIDIITGEHNNQSWAYIILQLRLPKAITAIITGGGLAIAGLLLQSLFRNPLAGPYVLGISSGASLGVALFVMASSLFAGSQLMNSPWGQVLASIGGSALIFFLILSVSGRIRDTASLLIVGIMFGSVTTALVNVLQYFSRPELLQKFVIWTMGSLSSTGWEHLKIMSILVGVGLVFSMLLIKPLNAWLLGENHARVSGVSVKWVRIQILISSSLITGTLTAFCGPIAFIGLAVPHLARFLFNTTNHRILFPGVFLFGSSLLLLCDIIAQIPGRSMVLPINAVTALFGAPVILWILLGQKKLRTSF